MAFEEITFEAVRSETEGSLKCAVEKWEGIPALLQLLLFNKKWLEDCQSLKECHIQKGSV